MKIKPHSFCSSCFHSAIMWWSIPSRYTRICSTQAVLLSWSSPTALSSCSTSFCPCSPSNFPTRKIRQSGKICSGLTNTQVTRYCSNDSVNLILSSYAEKAAAQQVNITICATVSSVSGHGIGVKSMVSVVDRYQGVYGFFAEDGEFRFQASM